MTNVNETEAARAELQAAQAAVAAFDGGTLVTEDGTPNEEARAELNRRQQRLTAAQARAVALGVAAS
jgi:hypothetical protein